MKPGFGQKPVVANDHKLNKPEKREILFHSQIEKVITSGCLKNIFEDY